MVRLSLTHPGFELDITEFERQIATFANANNITTQVQYEAAVAALTAGQQTAAVKAILRAIRVHPPLE